MVIVNLILHDSEAGTARTHRSTERLANLQPRDF